MEPEDDQLFKAVIILNNTYLNTPDKIKIYIGNANEMLPYKTWGPIWDKNN